MTTHRGLLNPFYKMAHRSRHCTPADMQQLTLHCSDKPNDPPLLDLDAISRLAANSKSVHAQRWPLLRRLVSDASLYEEICSQPAQNAKDANITADDHVMMMQSGKFAPLDGDARRLSTVFTVPEHAKKRRRVILWPPQLNTELQRFFEKFDIDISDGVMYARDLVPGQWAVACDLTKSFWQVPLAPEVQPFYAYRHAGNLYCHTVLPMGVVFAPALMQCITSLLAEHGRTDVVTQVHIDNVRFVGPKESVIAAHRHFVAQCEAARVTLGVEPNKYHPAFRADAPPGQVPLLSEPHQIGEFCGTVTNYVDATVRVADKIIVKLREDFRLCNVPGSSIRDVQILFGRLFYASRVLRIGLAKYYFALKFYRRAMNRLSHIIDHEKPITMWTSAYRLIENWIAELAVNSPVRHLPLHMTPQGMQRLLVIATDASTTGWGAVLCDEASGYFTSAGGKWDQPHTSSEINNLEVDAIRNAFDIFRNRIVELAPNAIVVLVDNTSAQAAVRKGYSPSEVMNASVLRALQSLGTLPTHIEVRTSYINTHENVADELSRGLPVNPREQPS